jgi:copper chaperone CopZ
MHSLSFQIPVVATEAEVQRIATRLAALPGVRSVQGDRRTKIFAMTWNAPTTRQDIQNALAALGYTPDMPQAH